MFIEGNNTSRSCDGISRRSFVQTGAVAIGGLSLADILQARAATAAATGTSAPATSVIFVELAGGPTHFETYDPKPDAPAEYRGPLGTVETALPGVHFSELMVEQAKIADKLAIIRSLHHPNNSHDTSSHLTQTGYYKTSRKGGENTFPSVGSVTAHLKGAGQAGVPAYVAVPGVMRNGKGGFLGQGHNPFEVGGDPNSGSFQVRNMDLAQGLTFDHLSDRRQLLAKLDAGRRVFDQVDAAQAVDDYTSRAFEMVSGVHARQAFDLRSESETVRARYGRNTVGQSLLLARRLVEAGVSFVSVRVPGWDDHSKIDQAMQKKGPDYDRGMAALISDLHERGLNEQVLVVAMGEFGRTPRVNRNAGRDHWGAVMSGLVAGGKFRMGQVIGSSNAKGETPATAPYRPENLLASVYHHLGIDPALTIEDHDGRPRYLLELRSTIAEL